MSCSVVVFFLQFSNGFCHRKHCTHGLQNFFRLRVCPLFTRTVFHEFISLLRMQFFLLISNLRNLLTFFSQFVEIKDNAKLLRFVHRLFYDRRSSFQNKRMRNQHKNKSDFTYDTLNSKLCQFSSFIGSFRNYHLALLMDWYVF